MKQALKVAGKQVSKKAVIIAGTGAGVAVAGGVTTGVVIHNKKKKNAEEAENEKAKADSILNAVEDKIEEEKQNEQQTELASLDHKLHETTPVAPVQPTPVAAPNPAFQVINGQQPVWVPGLGYVVPVATNQQLQQQMPDFAPVEESGAEKINGVAPNAPVNNNDVVLTAADMATGKKASTTKGSAAKKAEQTSVTKQ